MKITNSLRYRFSKWMIVLLGGCMLLSGCGQSSYDMPYEVDSEISSFRMVNISEESKVATPFAAKLCVSDTIDMGNESLNMEKASGVALFDINNTETLYAKNVHEKLYPASLTKVMTALVAMKYGSSDMMLTASSNIHNLEPDAQVCGLKPGDQMTLSQALHILLIQSANDVAIMIAEGVSGSMEAFVDTMNKEALAIGATNTHFVNPHGLSDESHYTTVYDLYLIMNEALKYDMFNEIIRMSSYDTVYYDNTGSSKELSVRSTNRYLAGDVQSPAGITVLGGKTGTTNAAGNCLILLSKDTAENPFISVILKSETKDDLYIQMTELLSEINN